MKKIFKITCLLFTIFNIPAHTDANPGDLEKKNTDVFLEARTLEHSENPDLLIARGAVRLSDGIDLLEADTVIYNPKDGSAQATGHVKLYRPSGEIITGNYVSLKDHMKKVLLKQLYLVTKQGDKFSAKDAVKNNQTTIFHNATYSPCELCKRKPNNELTWQLRASKVTRDEESQNVYYRNVFLDFKGAPVFYMPYFFHPDPKVKRRSGLLMPSFSSNSSIGSTLSAPVYVALNDQHDLLITPTYMSKEKGQVLAAGEYRGLFKNGFVTLSGSSVKTKSVSSFSSTPHKADYHGHGALTSRFDLNENWRFKTNLAHVSSPTYFRRFYFVDSGRFFSKGTLDSTVAMEGFYGQNYARVGGYNFQNLRAEIDSKTIPLVTPTSEFHYTSESDEIGGHWKAGIHQNHISRRTGTRMTRLSSWANYTLPFVSKIGTFHQTELETRGDVYDIQNFTPIGTTLPLSHRQKTRAIPTFSLLNSYPLTRQVGNKSVTIEPLIKAVVSPANLNSFKIPNEDSQDFEFDTTNLFKTNRAAGFDTVDSGQRLNYGANFQLNNEKLSPLIKFFLGQSYSFSKETHFSPYSGVYKGRSDYLASIALSPHPYFSARWNARLDRNTFNTHKNLLQTTMGPEILNLNLSYISIHKEFFQNQYVQRKQVTATLSSRFHENWSGHLRATKELAYNPGDLEHGAGLKYTDDCFSAQLDFYRTFYTDRDLRPSKTILLTLSFKNLGTYSTGRISLNSIGTPEDENSFNPPK